MNWGRCQPEQQASVTVMARRTRMLSKMLDDLLAILTAETGNLAHNPIDLAQLVDSLVLDFQPVAWQSHLTISAELAPAMPLILGDAIQSAAGGGQSTEQCRQVYALRAARSSCACTLDRYPRCTRSR